MSEFSSDLEDVVLEGAFALLLGKLATPKLPAGHARSHVWEILQWLLAHRTLQQQHYFMPRDPLPKCRKLALSLPEAHEVEAWGEPTFRVKNKIFAMYAHANNHHGGGRNAMWCKAAPVNQRLMVEAAPNRFFVPPYVGPSGWIGVWLDGAVDWSELEDLLRDAWRMTAPKKLVAALKEN